MGRESIPQASPKNHSTKRSTRKIYSVKVRNPFRQQMRAFVKKTHVFMVRNFYHTYVYEQQPATDRPRGTTATATATATAASDGFTFPPRERGRARHGRAKMCLRCQGWRLQNLDLGWQVYMSNNQPRTSHGVHQPRPVAPNQPRTSHGLIFDTKRACAVQRATGGRTACHCAWQQCLPLGLPLAVGLP